MRTISINIPDSKFDFFVNLFKNLSVDFIETTTEEINEGSSDEEIIENIKQSVKEMNLVTEGKLKARPLKELLDEL